MLSLYRTLSLRYHRRRAGRAALVVASIALGVATLVSLTLIPAICLFLFAYALVNRSIDKWFSVPVDRIFGATVDMTAEWMRDHESLARSFVAPQNSINPSFIAHRAHRKPYVLDKWSHQPACRFIEGSQIPFIPASRRSNALVDVT